jgi:putative inorganic carbon (HCO3(-)) transporter
MEILGLRSGRADANLPASSVYCEALSYLTLAFLIAFTPFIKGPSHYLVPLSANLLLFLWLLTVFQHGTIRISVTPLTVIPLLFLGIIAASSLYTINHSATIYGLMMMGSFITIGFITAATAPCDRLWRGLLRVVVIVATLLSLYALFQLLTNTGNYPGRANSTFVNPNSFSGYLVLIMPLIMVLSIRGGRYRYHLLGVVALNYAALLATGTGGRWIVFVGAIFFVLFIFWLFLPTKRKRLIPLTVTFLSVTALFLIPAVMDGGGSMAPKAVGVIAPMADRFHIWESTWEIIKGAPIIGRGFWTFNAIYPMYKNILFEGVDHSFSHNDYLQLWAELGIAGLLVFLLLLFLYFRSGLRAVRNRNVGLDDRLTVLGILSGSLLMLVHTNIDFDLYIPAILLIFWGYLGYMMSVERRGTSRGREWEVNFSKNRIYRFLGVRKLTIILAALFLFSSLWLTKPYLASLYDKKGMALMTAGDTEVGVRLARRAVEMFPYESSYHYNLGLALSNLDDGKDVLKEAEEEMKRAIALDPYRAELYFRVAEFYKDYPMQVRGEKAVEMLIKAVERNPSNSTYLYNLGVLHLILGELQPGIDRLEEYLAWKPEDSEARLELSKAYREGGRYEEAIREIENVMAATDLPYLHILKGDLLQEMGRYDHALSEYREALSGGGSEGEVWYAIGSLHLGQEQLEEAEEGFLNALTYDRDNKRVLNGLAALYEKQGRVEEAAEMLKRFLSIERGKEGMPDTP